MLLLVSLIIPVHRLRSLPVISCHCLPLARHLLSLPVICHPCPLFVLPVVCPACCSSLSLSQFIVPHLSFIVLPIVHCPCLSFIIPTHCLSSLPIVCHPCPLLVVPTCCERSLPVISSPLHCSFPLPGISYPHPLFVIPAWH